MTRITIVTVTRNDLRGLQRTFASLVGQTYRNVEHIVIDGASTDGSMEWLRQAVVFDDTALVSEPDDGIFDAMNKGVARARGDIVYFLNSGDCLASDDILAFVAESYERERWEWALGLTQMVDEAFLPTRRCTKPRYSWVHKTFWKYDLSHQAVFVRRDILRDEGGFDRRYRVSADCHLATKLGRLYRPRVWPRVIASTLEGGVSGTSMTVTHMEFHRARVDVLRLGRITALVDAGWTWLLIARTLARQSARRYLLAHAGHRVLMRASDGFKG